MQSYNKSSETNDTLLSNSDTILSKYKINYFYSQYSYGSHVSSEAHFNFKRGLLDMQRRLIWSSNEARLILGRMYLKLRRDVSVTASGRTRYCVGTYKMLRRDAISGTPKTPEHRYFYGNIWQIMAILLRKKT